MVTERSLQVVVLCWRSLASWVGCLVGLLPGQKCLCATWEKGTQQGGQLRPLTGFTIDRSRLYFSGQGVQCAALRCSWSEPKGQNKRGQQIKDDRWLADNNGTCIHACRVTRRE